MPLNFRKGLERIGIVVSVLGGVAGGIRGYFLAAHTYALSANGFRQESESVLVDYAVALLLPVLGFWLPWELSRFLDWILSGLSRKPTARWPGQPVQRKRPGTARQAVASDAKRPAAERVNQRTPRD
jgi:hypothetical protein